MRRSGGVASSTKPAIASSNPSELCAFEPSRREALKALTVCACCTVAATGLLAGDAQAAPDDRLPPAKPGKTDAGPIADFAKEGLYDSFARTKQFYVARKGNKIVAFSSICTHRRCVVKKNSDTLLKCPCHQAEYNEDGIVTKKPASISLPHYAVSLDEHQHLIVDTAQSFEERKWDDPAASLTVEAPTTQAS